MRMLRIANAFFSLFVDSDVIRGLGSRYSILDTTTGSLRMQLLHEHIT